MPPVRPPTRRRLGRGSSRSGRLDFRPGGLPTLAAVVGVAGALAAVGGAAHAEAQESPAGWLEVEVASVGVDLATGAPLALVHDGWDEVLPIWIGEPEAQAMLFALQGVETPRPLTHDLLVAVLGGLDVELAEVRIHDMREGTYIGSLHLRRSGEEELVAVDSRPSDGLALALRTGARIRVARPLLEGISDVDFVSTQDDRPILRIRGATVTTGEGGSGVEVLHVTELAGRRGLEAGDRIVAVGERPIEDVREYLTALRGAREGDTLPLTVLRDGEEVRVALPPRGGTGRVGP